MQRLNSGALPVPVSLISQQSVGPSLGEKFGQRRNGRNLRDDFSVSVSYFVVQIAGLGAVLALGLYTIIILALFKLIPVTLTAAGIAGFILSVGMAVDANILIFERMKEELKKGKNLQSAISEGFSRAWLSIRDSNISSLITAGILFWMGTSMIKGIRSYFGGVGILISMFSAITVSRTLLLAIGLKGESKISKFLFGQNQINLCLL